MEILHEKPKLTYDDDRLRIFFLGVGYAFSRVHNHTNFLIIKGNSDNNFQERIISSCKHGSF